MYGSMADPGGLTLDCSSLQKTAVHACVPSLMCGEQQPAGKSLIISYDSV